MKQKPFVVVGLFLAVLVAGISAGFFYLQLKKQTFKTSQTKSEETNIPETNLDIEKISFLNGLINYEVRGILTKPFWYESDVLVGDIIINGDDSSTPIRIILGVKSGDARVGVNQNGAVNFSTQSTDQVQALSQKYSQIAFRISKFDSIDPQDPEIQSKQYRNEQAQLIEDIGKVGTSVFNPSLHSFTTEKIIFLAP